MSKLMLGASSLVNTLCPKYYTLNTGGSYRCSSINQDLKVGTGCVIRDDEGALVVAASWNLYEQYYHYCDAALVEAEALKIGLELAKNRNLILKLVKVDNKEVFDHVLGHTKPSQSKPRLSRIIEVIKGMRDCFFQIKLIDRGDNKVADVLAHLGSELPGKTKIYEADSHDLPLRVFAQIQKEKYEIQRKETDDHEDGPSLVIDMCLAGVVIAVGALLCWGLSKFVIAGGALLCWGLSKFFSGPNKSSKILGTLHFSGSDKNQKNKGGAGFIIRDKLGNLIVAGAYNLDCSFPDCHIAIENATALRNGLQMANNYAVKLDLIQGNNEEVINRVHNKTMSPPRVQELSDLIEEITALLSKESIPLEQVEFMGEKANNHVAHELAIVGLKMGGGCSTNRTYNQTYYRVQDLPQKVLDLVNKDKKVVF